VVVLWPLNQAIGAFSMHQAPSSLTGLFFCGLDRIRPPRFFSQSPVSPAGETEHRERKIVPNNHRGQLRVWGRANSVNVQKVLWCLRELDLTYQRIDAGMAFGKNRDPEYLAMNPNGRVPTLVDGDFVLWESNSIMRYLVLAYGKGSSLYPDAPKRRASVERWLDWTLSTLQPVDRPVLWGLVRTPPGQRDMVAIQKDVDAEAAQWRIVDHQLATRRFIEGDDFSIADIALGAYARRWLGVEGVDKPRLSQLERWFAQFAGRPGFQQFIAPPMS
jgi:glutathione S-transferase